MAAKTNAVAAVVLSTESSLPQINITVESIESVYFTYSSFGAAKTYPPLTKEEKADYYKAYDPMTGLRIAATLSGFFLMALLYVLYKSKCKRMKIIQGPGFEESMLEHQQPSTSWPLQQHQHGWEGIPNRLDVGSRLQLHSCESGRDTPLGSSATHHSTPTIKSPQPQYYADDRDMPAWKIYAKELFLYGGSGLWRSASLKGSDPVLLLNQAFSDESMPNSRGQLRSGSLSGSVMGRLGARHEARKTSSINWTNGSHSRLQVPSPNFVLQAHHSRHRHLDVYHPDNKLVRVRSERYSTSSNSKRTKNLPGRSVSFRESDMTNYGRARLSRSRQNSVRSSRVEQSRMNVAASNTHVDGRQAEVPYKQHRRSLKLASRQSSVRASPRDNAKTSTALSESNVMSTLPPPSANTRTVVLQRIPLHKDNAADSKAAYARSFSLNSEPNRGWRYTIANLIRANSTSGNRLRGLFSSGSTKSEWATPPPLNVYVAGHSAGQKGETAPSSASRSCGKSHNSLQTSQAHGPLDDSLSVAQQDDTFGDHIDICVITATPAASPCTSVRSTLSADSIEMASIKSIPPAPLLPTVNINMSVRDRRKCFASMKSQTIDHDQEAPVIDLTRLAPPPVDFGPSLLHPVADLRCRSTSPARLPSMVVNNTWLQVVHDEPYSLKIQTNKKSLSNKSLPQSTDQFILESPNRRSGQL